MAAPLAAAASGVSPMQSRSMLRPFVVVIVLALVSPGVHASRECPPDFNGDGQVSISDINLVLSAYGPCGNPSRCPQDIVPPGGDDQVTIADITLVLTNFGPCLVLGGGCELWDGSSVPSGWTGNNDCNGPCSCTNGVLECETDLDCFASCFVEQIGKMVTHGTDVLLPDGCNSCQCFHGVVTCTNIVTCFEPCFYFGKFVTHGTGGLFIADCTCVHGGYECNNGCYVPELGDAILNSQSAVIDSCTTVMCEDNQLVYTDLCD
jgi:hypothetical protein